MTEAKCKNCEAVFKLDDTIPEDMVCFCNCVEFEVTEEQKEVLA